MDTSATALVRDRLGESLSKLTATLFVNQRFKFSRSVYGPELCNDSSDKTFELCTNGYGDFISNAITRDRQAYVFLDIGANAGVFGLLADRQPSCLKVHAFEPIPQTFYRLGINAARNKAGKMALHRAAIAASGSGFAMMSFNPRHTGMAKLENSSNAGIRVRTVGARELDQLIGVPDCAVTAKVDVEGAESQVVRELSKTNFFCKINRLIVEMSRRNAGPNGIAELEQDLASLGFHERDRHGPDEHYDAVFEKQSS